MSSKPAQTFRVDGIKATVWSNRSDTGIFYTTTIVRSYKDANDEWKETNSFMADHLPKVELVIREAFKFICLDSKNQTKEEAAAPDSHSVKDEESTEVVHNNEEATSNGSNFAGREARRRGGERSR